MIVPLVRVCCDGKACKAEPLLFEGALIPVGALVEAGWLAVRNTERTEHFCPTCQVSRHAEARR